MKFTTKANAKRQTGFTNIGGIDASAKMVKNSKYSNQYTYAIYLAPFKVSGYNVCPMSTPECRGGCLATSGYAGIDVRANKTTIRDARIKRTRLFFEHREFFMEWMIAEIEAGQRKAKKDNYFFSARLNATSDIEWENVKYKGLTIFEIFPDVQFYDYAKDWKRLEKKLPKNYHLTLSYTGRNLEQCLNALSKGINVAVVFNIKNVSQLPKVWNNHKVINGDLTDYRPEDGKGVIVGLKWKNIGNPLMNKRIRQSIFVVQPATEIVEEWHSGDVGNVQNKNKVLI